MINLLKPYLIAGAFAGALAMGWTLSGWYHDSRDLAAEKERQKILALVRGKESAIAKSVEDRLQELRANERIIEQHTTEIIERPVYRNICIDADGLRIINGLAAGYPAEPVSEMPRKSAED